jgi:ribose 5-phosphate isomerase A
MRTGDAAAQYKSKAAERALAYLKDGMRIGLGSGSTATKFIELAGARVREGLELVGVPTSEATRRRAERAGIPLTTLEETPVLDLTVDGADELDPQLRLIKGGGGALLKEKIVASASKRMIVIVDASKCVSILGAFPLPIEVVRFGVTATARHIEAAAAEVGCRGSQNLRRGKGGEAFLTEAGNVILDCTFGRIPEPEALEAALQRVPGVVETGLFLDIADAAIVAGPEGVEVLTRAGLT